MREIQILPVEDLGRNFIPAMYLPDGKDEYYLRNQQNPKPPDFWRHLHADEIETLVK